MPASRFCFRNYYAKTTVIFKQKCGMITWEYTVRVRDNFIKIFWYSLEMSSLSHTVILATSKDAKQMSAKGRLVKCMSNWRNRRAPWKIKTHFTFVRSSSLNDWMIVTYWFKFVFLCTWKGKEKYQLLYIVKLDAYSANNDHFQLIKWAFESRFIINRNGCCCDSCCSYDPLHRSLSRYFAKHHSAE